MYEEEAFIQLSLWVIPISLTLWTTGCSDGMHGVLMWTDRAPSIEMTLETHSDCKWSHIYTGRND